MNNSYFEILAQINLYPPQKGRSSFIVSGYRPHIYFSYSEPNNSQFASDCIFKLIHQDKLFPGDSAEIKIIILRHKHLVGLLNKNVKIKIKEGTRFVGEGYISKIIGEFNF